MNAAARRAFFRRVLLVIWGMFTLVLLFCIGLLVVVMMRQGQDPLALVKKPIPAPTAPVETSEQAAIREVALYFADAEGRSLVAEPRGLELGDFTVENCRKALEALIRGPQGPLAAILPQSVKVRGLYLLEDGELVVDLSMDLDLDLKKLKSAALESLMIHGVANTLAQPVLQGSKEGGVAKVRFLIEGSVPRESFPDHLDVSVPVYPGRQLAAETPQAQR